MKRFLFVLALSLVLVMAVAGSAFASFGPHGSYTTDTDACAGCHRAHTAFSTIARIDFSTGQNAGEGSALLVSSATNMDDFCYACHGNGGPGASTNVEAGKFDAGPSADALGVNGGGSILYNTNSSFDATLNGGGFATFNNGSVTSNHTLGAPGVIWGYGNSAADSASTLSDFNCTSCHDPHGSSNYRLLNDKLMGDNVVGGYVGANTPQPFVISAEEGYPAGGFAKHTDYMAAGYKPNYTTPEYRYNGDSAESMSGWCAGCHEQYTVGASAYSYGTSETAVSNANTVGSRTRHRHPVNMNLQTGRTESGQMTLATDVATNSVLPLEMAFSKDTDTYRGAGSDYNDVVGCLTCHFAHGTDATMAGWARSSLDNTATPARPGTTATWFPVLTPAQGGVNPNFSSALLRADNRGVCERCHNK